MPGCGRAGRLECDHIQPVAKGGDPFDMGNLRTLCRSCHIEISAAANRQERAPARAALMALALESAHA